MTNICDDYYSGLFTPLTPQPQSPTGSKYGTMYTDTGLTITGHWKSCVGCKGHPVPEISEDGALLVVLLIAAVIAIMRSRRKWANEPTTAAGDTPGADCRHAGTNPPAAVRGVGGG